jgi:hypothetical protein
MPLSIDDTLRRRAGLRLPGAASATIDLPARPDQLARNPRAGRPAESHEEAPQEPDERNVKCDGRNDQACLHSLVDWRKWHPYSGLPVSCCSNFTVRVNNHQPPTLMVCLSPDGPSKRKLYSHDAGCSAAPHILVGFPGKVFDYTARDFVG